VIASLSELGMPDVRFDIVFERVEASDGLVARGGKQVVATSEGAETAEFYLSTNPGESPRQLARVASGGGDLPDYAGPEVCAFPNGFGASPYI
jgi:DNA repair protein RecN (Recombination protein N)